MSSQRTAAKRDLSRKPGRGGDRGRKGVTRSSPLPLASSSSLEGTTTATGSSSIVAPAAANTSKDVSASPPATRRYSKQVPGGIQVVQFSHDDAKYESPWPTRSATYVAGSEKLLKFAYETKPYSVVQKSHFSKRHRPASGSSERQSLGRPKKDTARRRDGLRPVSVPGQQNRSEPRSSTVATTTTTTTKRSKKRVQQNHLRTKERTPSSTAPRRLRPLSKKPANTWTQRKDAQKSASSANPSPPFSVGETVLLWERFCKEWLEGKVVAVSQLASTQVRQFQPSPQARAAEIAKNDVKAATERFMVFAMPRFYTTPVPWTRVKLPAKPNGDEAIQDLAIATATARVNRHLRPLNAAIEKAISLGIPETHACVREAADLVVSLEETREDTQDTQTSSDQTNKPTYSSPKIDKIGMASAAKRYHVVKAHIEALEQKRRLHLASNPLSVREAKQSKAQRQQQQNALLQQQHTAMLGQEKGDTPPTQSTPATKNVLPSSVLVASFANSMTKLEWMDTVLAAKKRELGFFRNEAGRELQVYWVQVAERMKQVRQQRLMQTQLQSKERLAKLEWQFPGVEVEKVLYPQHIDGFDLSQLDIQEFLNPPTEEELAAQRELEKTRHLCATKLQARLRSFVQQREMRRIRQAAVTLQQFHRNVQASMSADQRRLREEARQARDLERDMASSVIAFWWAGLLSVRQAKLQEYSAKKLQQNFAAFKRRQHARAHRQRLHTARNVAAKIIQRCTRIWLQNLHAFQQAQQSSAATDIQCFWRTVVAIRESTKRRVARIRRRAAGRIQIWWKFLNLNFRWKCTIHFQRVARSMLARRAVLRLKIALENEDDNDRLSKSYARKIDQPLGGVWRNRIMDDKVRSIIAGGGKCVSHVITQRS